MLHEDRLLIDGALVEAEGARTFANLNPATDEVLGVAGAGAPAMATPSATAPGSSAESRRAERRARQHELARAQVLDAAEAVFGDKGIVAATIKEIAELAGYSVGAVYTFFDSKGDLLAAVLARRGVEMTDGIERVVNGPGPALDRLVDLARFEVAFFTERPAFARLYLRTAAIGPLLPEPVAGEQTDFLLLRAVRLTTGLLRSGQEAGEVCDGPPEVLSRILSGIVTSYQTFAVGEGDHHLLDGFGTDHLADLVRRTFARRS